MTQDTDDSTTEQPPNMLVFVDDGPTVECESFKAIDAGVLLFEDAERTHVVGFVPHSELRFVLPYDVGVEYRDGGESEPEASETTSEGDREKKSVTTEPEMRTDVASRTDVAERPGDPPQPSAEDGVGGGEEERADAEETGDDEARREDDDGEGGRADGAAASAEDSEVTIDEAEERYVDAETLEVREDGDESETAQNDEGDAEQFENGETVGAATEDPSSSAESASSEDLTRLGGLGETYATRLRDAGIDSLTALRESSVEDVASVADVAPRRAERWIDAAKKETQENT